jgi:hypothetical protein
MSPDPKAPQHDINPQHGSEEEIEDLEAPAQAQSDVEGGCVFTCIAASCEKTNSED